MRILISRTWPISVFPITYYSLANYETVNKIGKEKSNNFRGQVGKRTRKILLCSGVGGSQVYFLTINFFSIPPIPGGIIHAAQPKTNLFDSHVTQVSWKCVYERFWDVSGSSEYILAHPACFL